MLYRTVEDSVFFGALHPETQADWFDSKYSARTDNPSTILDHETNPGAGMSFPVR